ncbi:ADP-ribosyltransferase [uncultured Parvimonas sp.]|uniref:ADP-ribosyltransferase n=1 Tax=uncultured Parvimonas sp. TaxID=747372 RepID=UPI00325FD744
MKNNSYWEKRLANDLWNTYNDTSKYQKELIEIYKKATDEILEELYRIASKYEENGVISRSEFYKAEHLKRMEKGFNDVLKGLGEKIENKGSKIILNAGEDVVKKTGKSLGIDINYNEDLAKKLIQTKWKGSNFSKRIWRNSKKLEKELNTQVKKGILTGKPTAQIAMELNKSMGSGLSNSARLIRTETMHHMNDINLAHMKDSGISKVKEIVTLDERTSSTCKVHNNKIHDIDKAPILPRHPNCRCVLVPYVDVDELHNRETLLEDKDNDIIYSNMSDSEIDKFFYEQETYKKWKENLSEEDKEIINYYTMSEHMPINNISRRGYDKYIADAMESFNNDPEELYWVKLRADEYFEQGNKLEKALQGYETEKAFITYRGTTGKPEYFKDLILGKEVILDKGFLSTSLMEEVTEDFIEGYNVYKFEITVPKGYTNGAFIKEFSDIQEEQEFLFQRSSKFKVLEINDSDGVRNVKLEAINDKR